MKRYERYLENILNENPDTLSRTIHMVVHDINFIKIKESNGDLRWRYDAALALAWQMYRALLNYGYGRTPLDKPMCVALQQADIQLDLIIRDMHENFGDEVDLRKVRNWMVANQNIIKQTHDITRYYPGTTGQLELRLRRAG